jgi:hypothetical protein
MENVDIFYDPRDYFSFIWYTLKPFGIVCGRLVHFSHFGMFGMFGPIKIWQPWLEGVVPQRPKQCRIGPDLVSYDISDKKTVFHVYTCRP